MGPSSIHSQSTGSTHSIHRSRNNHNSLSKIVTIVLATLATIASYAFLPPTGAAIASAIIISLAAITLIRSYRYSSAPSHINPPTNASYNTWIPDTRIRVPYTEWSRLGYPDYNVWIQMGSPRSFSQWNDREYISLLPNSLWHQMGRPSYNSWNQRGRPKTFADWQRNNQASRREVVRDNNRNQTPRVPQGTNALTPSSPSREGNSYLPNWTRPSSYFRSTHASTPPSVERRDVVRPTPSDSGTHIPVGRNNVTSSPVRRYTSRSSEEPQTTSSFSSPPRRPLPTPPQSTTRSPNAQELRAPMNQRR